MDEKEGNAILYISLVDKCRQMYSRAHSEPSTAFYHLRLNMRLRSPIFLIRLKETSPPLFE